MADLPPLPKGFKPVTPPLPEGFKPSQTPLMAARTTPETVPLGETSAAPVQPDPTRIKTDRDTALELAQFGIEVASMFAFPEVKAARTFGQIALQLGKRSIVSGVVGAGTEYTKDKVATLMGYPSDPHLLDKIVIHAGMNSLFEVGGGALMAAPKAYRAFRLKIGGEAYLQKLQGEAAEKAATEDLYRFMKDHKLETSIGRISGSRELRGIEKFGETTLGGMMIKSTDKAMLGELANAQASILSDFANFGTRSQAGMNLKNLLLGVDRGVDMVYSKGASQLMQMTGGHEIVDVIPEAVKAISDLERVPRSLERKGFGASVERSARRLRIEQEYEDALMQVGILRKSGAVEPLTEPMNLATRQRFSIKKENLTIEEAAYARSHFLKLARDLPEGERDVRPLAMKLAKAYNDSIKRALSGNPQALEIWDSMNRVYKDWAQKFKNGTLAKMMDADPHKVMELVSPEDTGAMQEIFEATHTFGSAAKQQQRWSAARRLWWQSQLKGAKEATGEESGEALARRIVSWDDRIKGDAKPMIDKYFSDPEGKAFVGNSHRLRQAIDTMAKETGGAASFHYWWAARGFIADVVGRASGREFAALTGFAGMEASGAALTAIMHSKRATDIFIQGLREASPKAGKVLSYIKPSAAANIMRAVKTGLQEIGALDTEEFVRESLEDSQGQVKPTPVPLPGPR